MNPSDEATKLCNQICQFFSVAATETQRLALAASIDFHASYLRTDGIQDIAALLFIECSTETGLTADRIGTLLGRVQKRIYRDARRQTQPLGQDPQSSRTQLTASFTERTIADFRRTLALRDDLIFEQYFIEGRPVAEVVANLALGKSLVYERMRTIQDSFKSFLADQPVS